VVASSTGRECFPRDASDLMAHLMRGIVTDIVDSRLLDFGAGLKRIAYNCAHVPPYDSRRVRQTVDHIGTSVAA
jgi:hypothetical protein